MPRWSVERRLDPAKVFHIADAIFKKGSDFTGAALSKLIGVEPVKMWNRVFRAGLTTPEAVALADGLEQWAHRLLGFAIELRELARQLNNAEIEPVSNRGAWKSMKRPRSVDELRPIDATARETHDARAQAYHASFEPAAAEDPTLESSLPADDEATNGADDRADTADLGIVDDVPGPGELRPAQGVVEAIHGLAARAPRTDDAVLAGERTVAVESESAAAPLEGSVAREGHVAA